MNYYNQETHPDQMYFLNKESSELLDEVNSALAEVVRRAQAISDVQMQVIHGKRTSVQQDEFFRKGVTQGAKSPHMYGTAVDIVPVIEGRISMEAEALDEVAMSMKFAAADLNTPIRWGGAWQITNLAKFEGMLEDIQAWYLEECVKEGVRPQLDPWHFELSVDE
tara:strand:- start:58 stop:552 length:495 start_codon:yes stop_codon:yes gene_type:complete